MTYLNVVFFSGALAASLAFGAIAYDDPTGEGRKEGGPFVPPCLALPGSENCEQDAIDSEPPCQLGEPQCLTGTRPETTGTLNLPVMAMAPKSREDIASEMTNNASENRMREILREDKEDRDRVRHERDDVHTEKGQ